jgi:hypothetical protein
MLSAACLTWIQLSSNAAAATSPAWLVRVNSIRVAAGLSPVTNNPAWTTGIAHHLRYMEKTPSAYLIGAYANVHIENPASPYYTTDGAAEGASSDLAYYTAGDIPAINQWLQAPFHAIGMLRPELTQVAFARDSLGNAGLDVISGLNGTTTRTTPVMFPGNGSTIDLATYGGEVPSPLQTCTKQHPSADFSNAGLPLIALLPQAVNSGMSAALTSPNGRTLTTSGSDLCLVDEKNFYSTDSVYGPTGRSILTGDHAVLVIPRTPLVAGKYRVTLNSPGAQPIAWTFNYAAPPTTMTISRPIIIAKGQSTVVAGHLIDSATRDNIGGATLVLYSRTKSTNPWTRIGVRTTSVTGIATELVKPNYTAQLEWMYGGSSAHGKSVSPITTVTIGHPPTTFTITKSVNIRKGQTTIVAGHLVDRQSGKNIVGSTVVLLARGDSTRPWVRIRSLTTSSTGIVTQVVRPAYTVQLEWVYAGSTIHAASSSPRITVTIT